MKIFLALLLLAFLSIIFTSFNFLIREQRWQWVESFGFPSSRPIQPIESYDISSITISDDVQQLLYNGVYFRSRDHMLATSYLPFSENGIFVKVSSTGTPEQKMVIY